MDLGDLNLLDALSDALESHPSLVFVDTEDADLLITDRPVDRTGPPRVLRLGTSTALAGAPAALILSLAHVLAAGVALPQTGDAIEAVPPVKLSPREREVLELLVDGASNKAIARALSISLSTVKYHLAAVFEKLGARTRSEAVAVALREALVRV